MACEDIRQKLAELRSDKRQLEAVIGNLQGAGLQAAQANLASLTAQIAVQEKALADCEAVAHPPPPQPFVARVKEIYCDEASREVGDEEPYLVIASVDMLALLAGLPLPKPAVLCFKVGPFGGFKEGTRRTINSKAFWDLNSNPRLIASPQDVAFLVAMCENDGASPDAVRGAANTALELSIVQNMGLAYQNFVSTLISAMAGAIDTASVAGLDPLHLNADDRIGRVKQLSLTTGDLDTIAALGSQEKKLSFSRQKASGKVTDQYTVTFVFEK
jgi:hypothetical protein